MGLKLGMAGLGAPSHFEYVYWIGGSPCSGKSSISQRLADRYCLELFSVDSAFNDHAVRLDPIRHPYLTNWQSMSWNERWMRPTKKLLQEVIACYEEHFSLILEDILAKTEVRPLLVEGSALLPDLVARFSPHKSNAVWIIPSPDFQKFQYSQRTFAQNVLQSCENPDVAFANWMERDIQFAGWVANRARKLHLNILTVDGTQTIEENAAWVSAKLNLDSTNFPR